MQYYVQAIFPAWNNLIHLWILIRNTNTGRHVPVTLCDWRTVSWPSDEKSDNYELAALQGWRHSRVLLAAVILSARKGNPDLQLLPKSWPLLRLTNVHANGIMILQRSSFAKTSRVRYRSDWDHTGWPRIGEMLHSDSPGKWRFSACTYGNIINPLPNPLLI